MSGDTVAMKEVYSDRTFAVKGLVNGRGPFRPEQELELMRMVDGLDSPHFGRLAPSLAWVWSDPQEPKDVIVMNLCEPNDPGSWTIEHAEHMTETLRLLHTVLNLVHRDVRPANFLMQGGIPILIDFGCAIAVGTSGPYAGSRFYASPRFLPLSDRDTFEFYPEDDLVSLVLAMFATFYIPEADVTKCPDANPDAIKDFWNDKLPPMWQDFIQAIESRDDMALQRWDAILSQLGFEDNSPATDVYSCFKRFLRLQLGNQSLWHYAKTKQPPRSLPEAVSSRPTPASAALGVITERAEGPTNNPPGTTSKLQKLRFGPADTHDPALQKSFSGLRIQPSDHLATVCANESVEQVRDPTPAAQVAGPGSRRRHYNLRNLRNRRHNSSK